MIILVSSFYVSCSLFQADPNFKITVDTTARADYGLSYPITYEFSLPAAATDLTVYEKKAISDSWTQIPTMTSDDFFNGVDAVRFDYTNDFAYVSVAFHSDSDDIFLLFKDSGRNLIEGVSFIQITNYYDNRKAACVITADDWIDRTHSYFKSACDAFQSRQIWFSPGLEPSALIATAWAEIQAELDEGYIEPVSHSRTHPNVPYDDYDAEVGGSKQDIINNLNLPSLNKKGSAEYVYAWTAPYGQSDAMLRSKLGTYKYLEDTAGGFSKNYGSFPSWNATDNLYTTWNRWAFAENKTASEMNAKWDTDYAAGNIYHLGMHPIYLSWETGSEIVNHLDYIKGKKDVWYVGMGHLFVYHYAKEQKKVNIEVFVPVHE